MAPANSSQRPLQQAHARGGIGGFAVARARRHALACFGSWRENVSSAAERRLGALILAQRKRVEAHPRQRENLIGRHRAKRAQRPA